MTLHVLFAMMAAATAPAPKIDQAVIAALREIESAGGDIHCKHEEKPASFGCMQPDAEGGEHFKMVGATTRSPGKPLKAGEIVLEDSFFGPGGSSTRYVGQTADHRHEIVATEGGGVTADTPPRLPSAETLIRRIIELYSAER